MTTGTLVESPVRGNSHAGFGGRPAETERPKGRHRAAGRPYWRRRVWVALVTLVAVAGVTAVGWRAGSGAAPRAPERSSTIEVVTGGRVVLRLRPRRAEPLVAESVSRQLAARLPKPAVRPRGRARISYRYDLRATVREVLRRQRTGGRVRAQRTPTASRILAPVIRQFERNTCEAAALEILLASAGRRVSQQRLQAAFARSGPLDPVGTGPQRTWGDPELGYVGRANGSGVAGGFGIYPRPVAATARRFGSRLDDLTNSSPSRLYARLLLGRAVMAWIGLADGPSGTWRSPLGRRVNVNFNQHTIVLTGIARGAGLRVVNPLEGTLEHWSRQRFEAAWRLLGRRALGVRG